MISLLPSHVTGICLLTDATLGSICIPEFWLVYMLQLVQTAGRTSMMKAFVWVPDLYLYDWLNLSVRFISEIEAVCRCWLADGPKNLLVCLLVYWWRVYAFSLHFSVSLCTVVLKPFFVCFLSVRAGSFLLLFLRSLFVTKFFHRERMQCMYKLQKSCVKPNMSWSMIRRYTAWSIILKRSVEVCEKSSYTMYNTSTSLIYPLSLSG